MSQKYPIFVVKYLGFVYIEKDTGGLPDPPSIRKACNLLKNKPKEARKLHPLFARGFETPLELQAKPSGLQVDAVGKDGTRATVLNNPIHKIAFVCDIGACSMFLVKRGGPGKFKCHCFVSEPASEAKEIAQSTAQVCNSMFRRVRKSVRKMTRKPRSSSASSGELASADIAKASELAAKKAAEAKQAVEEMDEDEPASPPKARRGTTTIDYIEGVGDDLAALVLGEQSTAQQTAEANLDDDMFSYGFVEGEAEC
eukprot:TRINITY_DN10877_c0_g1_i2.p4 TRINITY_DN10877_c0_g1~~TRINITY_DN10877_c0_g1_i2.p4  ORF type:complete len:255 (+),score=85.02 TRINITY_DN10877_c0_g1_i2:5462-6226(+)